MYFVADGCSDSGQVRDHNEDTLRIDCRRGLFVIADGMGGHAGGEIASGLAVETLFKSLLGREEETTACNAEALQSAIELANTIIFQDAGACPERTGMGTTLTVMCWDRCRFYFGHVGDSRAYRLREQELLQLTRDHTWIDMQVRAGVLSQKEAEHGGMRHILIKSLGTQPEIEPDIVPVDAQAGDRFLLCSDGLTDLVDHDDLLNILAGNDTPGRTCRHLVEKANAVGGSDNISAVVIDCYQTKWKALLKSVTNRIRR